MTEVYLDNSATTKPSAEVIDAMTSAMRSGYYNPSALYKGAVEAERALEAARAAVAAPLSMKPGERHFHLRRHRKRQFRHPRAFEAAPGRRYGAVFRRRACCRA